MVSPSPAPPFVRRTVATQTTLDRWSTRQMKLGTSDCVRMTAAHLRLLGHKVVLPPSGSYRTVRSALKVLAAQGHASIEAALDAMGLPRIAPAEAIVGDIVMLPGVDQLGALTVAVGNGRVFGYHEEMPAAVVLAPLEMLAAWRVDPR